MLGNSLSSRSDTSFEVLQGSVPSLLLCTLYTNPFNSLISRHAIPHHLYDDDIQVYIWFSSGNSSAGLNGLQSCLASVQSWMSTSKLKLNPDKTEFLLTGNERKWSKYHSMFPIELLGVKPYPAKSARNLGVNTSLCFRLSFSVSKLTLLYLLGILCNIW